MNAIENAIAAALAAEGNRDEANKAYLEFIKANFIIPIEKSAAEAEPQVLFLVDQGLRFLPVFSNEADFSRWAESIADSIQVLRLSGVDLLKGLGDEVTVCMNIGNPAYKEFNPAEIARMRSMVLKFFR